LITAKKCVTTYLPNELALKIDNAKALLLKLYRSLNHKMIERVGKRRDNKKVKRIDPL